MEDEILFHENSSLSKTAIERFYPSISLIFTAVGCMGYWGFIKELQNANIDVIGIDADPHSVGFHLMKKSYTVPLGNDPNFLNKILRIIDKEQVNAIISNPEEELLPLSKNKNKIEERGPLLLCPDFETVETCAYKKKTHEFFTRIGIPTPENYQINSVIFPCVIKPNFGRGSANVYFAKNKNDFDFYIKKVKNPLIQEFIPGEEYSVDILADRKGNALSIVPRIRIKVESGISIGGKTVNDAKIIKYCKKIVKKLKLFGPSCIQCIKNEEGIKFIEINARFGGGSILSLKADPSFVYNMIRIINDEKTIPSKGYKVGLTMLRYYSEIFYFTK